MLDDEGNSLTIPPSGVLARCNSTEVVTRKLGRFSSHAMEFGEVYNLPAPQENVIYITSRLVAERAKRDDVVAPGRMVTQPDGSRACIGTSDV